MAEVIQLVCDKCGTAEDVAPYRISTPGTGPNRAVALDLCRGCATPLHDLEAMGRTVSRSNRATVQYRPGRGGPTLRSKVMTQEEIDRIEEEDASDAENSPRSD